MRIQPSGQPLPWPESQANQKPDNALAQLPAPQVPQDQLKHLTAQGSSQPSLSFDWTAAEKNQTAKALHLAMKGGGTSEWNVLRILNNLSPSQRGELETLFNAEYGNEWGNLRQALKSELSGVDLYQAQKLLDQSIGPEVLQWKALEIHQAMKGGGTDEATLFRVLESTPFQDVMALQKQFQSAHGSYWQGDLRTALHEELSEDELARALRILDLGGLNSSGKASPEQIQQAAQELHLAMKGGGTDEDAIFRILETFGAQDIQAIEAQFHASYTDYWGGDLEVALHDDLGGDDLQRALQALATARQSESTPQTLARQRLEFVLDSGNDRSVRHQISALELDVATPAEKVLLLDKLLAGSTGDEDEMAILRILKHGDPQARSALFQQLASAQKLSQVLENIQGAEYEILLAECPQIAQTKESIADIFAATADQTDNTHKLMLHRLLDTARKQGFLGDLIQTIKPANPMQAAVIAEAISLNNRIAPAVVVAHRGGSPTHPENTLEAIESALSHGISAIEIDLSLTADGHLVLLHDHDPKALVPKLRQWGLEPNALYRPGVPRADSGKLKPTHELNLSELQAHYNYQGDGQVEKITLPVLPDVLNLCKKYPHLETIYLDTKLPTDNPELQANYAQHLHENLKNWENEIPGLRKKIVLVNYDQATLNQFKSLMPIEAGYQYSYDREDLNRFSWFGLKGSGDIDLTTQSQGHSHISAGDPKSPFGHNYDDYLAAIKRARLELSQSGSQQKLVAWTINDELKTRELLAAGVDEVFTDDPEGMLRLFETMGFNR